MKTNPVFYLCPMCFETFETEPPHHRHEVLRIDTTRLDVELRKPLMDNQGNLLSSAPRWFLEATGVISRRRQSAGTSIARH